MAKKRGKKTASRKKGRVTFKKLIGDDRTPKVLGLLALLIAVFLFIAFASYLFTWRADQSAVFQFSWGLLFNGEGEIQNALGRLGAIISHQFFYRGVGLSAFIFVLLFFVTGINLLFKRSIFPLVKIFSHSFFLIILLPVILSYIFFYHGFPFGGAYGNAMYDWFAAFLGRIGTGLFLFFVVLCYVVIVFNLELAWKWTKPAKINSDGEFDEIEEGKRLSKDISERENQEYGKEEAFVVTRQHKPDLEEDVRESEEPEEKAGFEKLDMEGQGKSTDTGEEPELSIAEVKEEIARDHMTIDTNYDPTLDLANYTFPTLDLLEDYGQNKISIDTSELERNKDQIIETLNNYNIKISKIKATVGPTVTLYEIVPAPGVRISRIKNLEDDIALSLAALGIRIIAPMPGKGTIGIEVPNAKKEIVAMRSMLASEKFADSKAELPIALGKTISNENFIADLAKMPHLLMAGATGQGKSVGLNAILVSLLYKKHPAQLKFVLVDPKKVELNLYQVIEKHYLAKLPFEEEAIITDTKQVLNTLNSLCVEMDQRYDLLKEAQVRNLEEYNRKFIKRKLNPQKGHRFMPYIVLVIDEFADLMMTAGKEIEAPIARLAQLARAIGIHLVIATQRPSVNIITGTIKANFPARIAFKVSSKVDSRTILDTGGADQLIGRGDMLVSIGGNMTRLQCPFVDTHEVERVVKFIGDQQGYPEAFELPEVVDESDSSGGSIDSDEKDEMFDEAARLVVRHQQGSTSLVQRRLKLGYNRAGRIMDQMEQAGIVGPNRGSKAREVLFKDEYELEQYLKNL